MTKKKKQILYFIIAFLTFIVIDRYLWMEERANSLFLWETGNRLGDPISCDYDFKINGNEITFTEFKNAKYWPKVAENRTHKFFFLGCYFGSLYLYDKSSGEISIYQEK